MIDYRNRHHREESHFGDLTATLVELSSAIDTFDAGTTVEDILRAIEVRIAILEGRPAFLANAVINGSVLTDSRLSANLFWPPGVVGATLEVTGPVSTFTQDDTDPTVLGDWSTDGTSPYSAWMRLSVAETMTVRVYVSAGMLDTILAIFGPSSSPPGADDLPYHLSDEGFIGSSRSSLHDWGVRADTGRATNGTSYTIGDGYSRDVYSYGINLSSGTWWICVWPYEASGWDTSEGDPVITIQRLLTRTKYSFSFTADAWRRRKYTKTFTAAATRRRPYTKTFVANSAARKQMSSSAASDAVMRRPVSSSFLADAEFGTGATTVPGSFISDAVIFGTRGHSVTADMVMLSARGSTFVADAEMTTTVTITETMTSDAVIARSMVSTVVADATITSGETVSTTLGSVSLGEGSLGDA